MSIKNLDLLIVDDEMIIRNGIKNSIDWISLNINVIGTAKDGLEAYELIKKHHPTIVIIDIRMPYCTGLELIEKIRNDNIDVKFIILSGYDDFKYAQQAIKLKVTSYLLKPVKKLRLIEEINLIKKTIQKEETKTAITEDVLLGRNALKEKFLNSLIFSEYKSANEINSSMEKLNINLPLTNLKTIIFDYNFPPSHSKVALSKDELFLFKLTMKNIIKETFYTQDYEFVDILGNRLLLIIQELKSNTRDIDTTCKVCLDNIYKFNKMTVKIGIGVTASHISDLSISFNSAIEALSYKLYTRTQKIFTPKDICTETKQAPPVSTLDSSNIFDGILSNHIDNIRTWTLEYLNSLFFVSSPPPKYIKGMCSYLIIDISKRIEKYGYSSTVNILHRESIESFEYFDEIQEWIINLFCEYSMNIKENNLLACDPVIDEVKRYIKEHINEKILLKDIADYVHLSESYLATLFKKITGDNFRNYVLEMKVDTAKTLLKNTSKSINEISADLGYSDYRSFNRIFKKLTNQTPSEFHSTYH
jgi:two-component system response regulator YesN